MNNRNCLLKPKLWLACLLEQDPYLSKSRGIYFGRGGCDTLFCAKGSWRNPVIKLQFPSQTLLYGEFCNEYEIIRGQVLKKKAFHIIDAMCLGGIDISHYTFSFRHKMIKAFSESLGKVENEQCVIRPKQFVQLKCLPDFLSKIEFLKVEKGLPQLVGQVDNSSDLKFPVIRPLGLLFLQSIKLTKDCNNSDSYEPSDFLSGLKTHFMWKWDDETLASNKNVARIETNGGNDKNVLCFKNKSMDFKWLFESCLKN